MKLRRRISIGTLALVAAVAMTAAAGGSATGGGTSVPLGAGVVNVETNLRYANAAAAGTGMVLTGSGEVVTNNHVIRGATTIRVTVSDDQGGTARLTGLIKTDAVLQRGDSGGPLLNSAGQVIAMNTRLRQVRLPAGEQRALRNPD